MKKLISILLAGIILVTSTSVIFAAKNEDVSSYAVDTLCDLGFIIGDDAGNLQLDKPVTRAEFATILLRVLGLNEDNAPVVMPNFSDVPQTHWAAGIIAHCSTLGIINGYGDGTFGPDDNVNYQDAITMMVRTLGYEPAVGNAGYPTGYLTKAGELGLTKGVSGSANLPILRKDIIYLVFNSLDVPLMTQSGYGTFTQYIVNDGYSSSLGTTNVKKTLLSEKHNIVKVQGIVEKASYQTSTSLNVIPTVTVNVIYGFRNKFNITGNKAMYVGNTDIEKYVGKEVVLFVEYDEFEDTCTVKSFYEVIDNNKIKINLTDIVSFENNELKYYVNNYKTATIKMDSESTIYYNDIKGAMPDNFFDSCDMSGYIELTLTKDNTNADYDTMFINAYDVFVVDEVRQSAGIVTAKTSTSMNRIYYDETDGDVVAVLTNGEWENLEEYDVLSIKYVDNGSKTFYEATIIDNTVTGTVESISNEYVTINDIEYRVLDCAVIEDDIRLGDEGTYYLDTNNNIVYHNTTFLKSDNYAYVINVASSTTMNNAQLKVLTKNNEIVVLDVAKKITVIENGIKNTVKDFVDNSLIGQIITYKVNSSDCISTIEIAVDVDDEDVFTIDYTNVNMTDYDEDGQSFRVDGKKYYIDNHTIIFNVYGDEDDYEVVALNNLAEGQVLNGADLYNIDEDRVIGVIALKSANTIRPTLHNAIFVTKISTVMDESGYETNEVTGYVAGEKVTYTCDNVTEDIIGRLVTPVYKANGEIKEFNNSVDVDSEYVSGVIDELNTKRKYVIINDEEYKIKSTTNIYIYDSTSNLRNKYKINEMLSYVDYVDGEWFIDGETVNAPTVYLYIYDGDVVDMVYYIS